MPQDNNYIPVSNAAFIKSWQQIHDKYLQVADIVRDSDYVLWVINKIAIEETNNNEDYRKTIYTISNGITTRRLTRNEIKDYYIFTHTGIN